MIQGYKSVPRMQKKIVIMIQKTLLRITKKTYCTKRLMYWGNTLIPNVHNKFFKRAIHVSP